MPKERRVRSSLSFDWSKVSPYPCGSRNAEQQKLENSLQAVGDEKEWEEARCPICMEHPHNAVLLVCSSREKGCLPYMCDTSHCHSNCLEQFRKSFEAEPSQDLPTDIQSSNAVYNAGVDQRQHRSSRSNGRQIPLGVKLPCPLCRGHISGWVVIEPARKFMNSKQRNCSLEKCNFSGTYSELQAHARVEHPSARPSDADPTRQLDWAKLESERDLLDLEDLINASQVERGEELSDEMILEAILEDNFYAFEPEPNYEWLDSLLMDSEVELPHTFLDVTITALLENIDHHNSFIEMIENDDLPVSSRSLDRRPMSRSEVNSEIWNSRSRAGFDVRRGHATEPNGSPSWGSWSNRGPRRSIQRRSRSG